jgi:hypothetical protein
MHRFQGGAAEDVVLGNLDGIEAKRVERLDQVGGAGDDGGRSGRVQPGYLAAPCAGHPGERLEVLLGAVAAQDVAVDAIGVVRLQFLVYRGERGRRAPAPPRR